MIAVAIKLVRRERPRLTVCVVLMSEVRKGRLLRGVYDMNLTAIVRITETAYKFSLCDKA